MRSSAAVRPAPRSAGDTPTVILEVAEQILTREGEQGLSIREVCARTGVTAPRVYPHFGDKQGLVAEVVDACLAEFDCALARGHMLQALATEGPTADRGGSR